MSVQLVSDRTLSGNDRKIEFKTTTAKAVLAATDFVTITTIVEGSRPEWKAAAFGTADAKPFVFRIDQTLPAGLYHIHASNSAGNRNISVPFTATGSEAVITVAIPGDTTGTWLTADGTKGLVIDIVLAAGSTLTGGSASTWGATAYLAASTQFNILSSTSNVARLADVGLKNDPDATAVYGLFRVGEKDATYRSERYLFRKTSTSSAAELAMSGFGFTDASTQFWIDKFPFVMCKKPTGLVSAAASFSIFASNTTLLATNLMLNASDFYGASWSTNNLSYSVNVPGLLATNNSGTWLQYNARL
jgi:hypothetical protein